MFRIGAHVSISGGFPKAVDREKDIGGNCGQLFVGSPRGWKVPGVDGQESEEFRGRFQGEDIRPWIVHGTYLINLATPKDDLGEKSVEAVQQELDASSDLGIPYYVFHPGAHTGAGREKGIENVSERLTRLDIPENITLLLENTAGKGTTVGKSFEELDEMVQKSGHTYEDIGVCLDTCHLYSAGYDFTSEEEIEEMLSEIDDNIGIENVHYLHLNDSKHPLGSEKDEHEHIGEGEIGDEGFRRFINHEKLRDKPMVLETPEGSKGFRWNIEKARELRE
ncbi:MAG: deoxyribonuclease IV [Candidatus Nanohaloarchaeota archaeon QJJ-7]|nr:deoxyribonuclease IV [Candidatus Nanohaloarchaeota archaeon QJJ-7]